MFLKNYKMNIIFALIFSFFVILPDFLLNFIWKDYHIFMLSHTLKEIFVTLILGYIISFIPKKSQLIVVFLFFMLSAVQIVYFAYFNTYIEPYQIGLVFSEYGDILDSLSMVYQVIVIAIVLLVFVLIIFNVMNKFIKQKSKKALKILISLFIVLPLIIKNNTAAYMPSNFHLSYINTIFSFDLYIVNLLKHKKMMKVENYKIIKTATQKPIVIMIMGESLNYKRMHLFGWDLNNTPNLDKLKKDSNFIYKPAISSGVNTPVSVSSFFHIKREPTVLFQQNNLVKLANQNGYKTYWFSMQKDSGGKIGATCVYAKNFKQVYDYKIKYDDELLKDLKKVDFSKKSFIVLHLRANHSPYEEYTPKEFYKWKFDYKDKHQYRYYSYMDSVLYVDSVLSNIINYMKNNHQNFVIYFVSDHAEMLGFKEENGKYGHSQLDVAVSYIPFLYYSDKYHKKLDKQIYNHYLISKMVASDLGYKVSNPNENGKYYINNVKLDGSAGWIEYNLTYPILNIKKEK